MENILIEWSQEYSICEIIDEQHKKMVDIINQLYDAFMNAKVKDVVAPILKQLEEYTIYHFSTEEKMFAEKSYTLTEAHTAEHNFFVEKIQEFRKRFEEDDSFLAYDVMEFLKNWLLVHILDSDRKYIKEIC